MYGSTASRTSGGRLVVAVHAASRHRQRGLAQDRVGQASVVGRGLPGSGAEAGEPAAGLLRGGLFLLDRLLDLLLVLAIRSDFDRSATAPPWYRASADPRLGAALQAIHENTAHPWTVPELAALSGLSRAAFARAFRDALGQAPMQYLTEWRMTQARDHLRANNLTLAQIADAVGYTSPFAFAAAFRRHHATPPGAWRPGTGSRTNAHPHHPHHAPRLVSATPSPRPRRATG